MLIHKTSRCQLHSSWRATARHRCSATQRTLWKNRKRATIRSKSRRNCQPPTRWRQEQPWKRKTPKCRSKRQAASPRNPPSFLNPSTTPPHPCKLKSQNNQINKNHNRYLHKLNFRKKNNNHQTTCSLILAESQKNKRNSFSLSRVGMFPYWPPERSVSRSWKIHSQVRTISILVRLKRLIKCNWKRSRRRNNPNPQARRKRTRLRLQKSLTSTTITNAC